MKILFFGDIVGQPGRQAMKKILPELKEEFQPDLTIANGENMAAGLGFSQKTLEEIMEAGVDWLTNGDHAFDVKEAAGLLADKKWPILRPLNWPGDAPGRGWEIIRVGARRILLVVLAGRVFMRQNFNDPFFQIKELLEDYSLKGGKQGDEAVDAILIDFHAEATSEKGAMAWFLDGRVSAVLGTHTHVPTADEKIMPQGTAFISDLGMVGPRDSVLGIEPDIIVKRLLTQRLIKKEVAKNSPVEINGVFLDIDDQTGLAKKIQRIRREIAPI
ncbi:MAG: TIGR00282 family metallophosphoesterase [Candidatus Portnoybacteria bacterium]|jgi:hypothetical protein|nr:TIGR00282 family metallophosphoesterase [Candidatus Portnoybacteria bacterium]